MKYKMLFPALCLGSFMFLSCSSGSEKPSGEGSFPEWAEGIVWYQIFPERFRNADPDNDPTAVHIGAPEGWEITSWTSDWYARAEWEKAKGPNFNDAVFDRRYGGDLQGVINKLDYLKELGVGGIYFNPVFDARTLHKYDASYYHHIDRFFGPDPEGDAEIMAREDPSNPSTWEWTSADKLFLKLLEEAKKRDIRVIIDGVWNHTGPEFWAFRDIVENQQQSDFKDWYDIISFDDPATPDTNEFDYHGWWGFKGLPELREENENLIDPVKEHIFAVTKRWMDPNGDGDAADGIDGWRLDVTEEVGMGFWKEWHNLVHSINTEAYTTAEIWTENAVNYVNRDLFDAVMNYRFAYAVVDFMIDREIDAAEFMKRLKEVRQSFPEGANLLMQNLIDSHDTPRVASMILNPGLEYDRDAHPRDGYILRKPTAEERRVQKLIALLQYTYIGSPMVYYGTEAGMWGADDPHDRKPMVWEDLTYEDETHHPFGEDRPADSNRFNSELFTYYARLGEIRNNHQALKHGDIATILTEGEVLAFSRSDKNQTLFVLLNRSEEEKTIQLDLPNQSYKNLLGDESYETESGKISVTLSPVSGVILE